jgi:ABC-type sugar transport system substrate-binding protein
MADRAKAMAATENILTAHTDLAGVFADNESSSAGAVQALKSAARGTSNSSRSTLPSNCLPT